MINILELPKAVKAATDLFRTGHELKNAAAWKNAQIVGNALSALLVLAVVIAHVFGYSMPDWANDTAVQYLAAGIASIANVVLIVWTSKKVGLPARISDDALPPIELQARARRRAILRLLLWVLMLRMAISLCAALTGCATPCRPSADLGPALAHLTEVRQLGGMVETAVIYERCEWRF